MQHKRAVQLCSSLHKFSTTSYTSMASLEQNIESKNQLLYIIRGTSSNLHSITYNLNRVAMLLPPSDFPNPPLFTGWPGYALLFIGFLGRMCPAPICDVPSANPISGSLSPIGSLPSFSLQSRHEQLGGLVLLLIRLLDAEPAIVLMAAPVKLETKPVSLNLLL